VKRHLWTAILAVLAVGGISSCGAGRTQQTIRPLASTGNVESALRRIKPLDTGGSRLLYLYERGLVLHEGGDYRASNEALDKAEALLDDLYTKSLSREIGGLMIGDYLVQYRGERFEAAYVHYYKVMNYLRLGDVKGAAVECRRLNHKLQLYQDAGKSFYVNDPFLQYISGLVYAAAGERVDADVSLRVARDSYRALGENYRNQMPRTLVCDLAANATAMGRLADAERYRADAECPEPSAGEAKGSLRLIVEYGHVPLKVEESLVLPIYRNEVHDGFDQNAYCRELSARRGHPVDHGREVEYLLKVAWPVMQPTPGGVDHARIRALPLDATVGAITPAHSPADTMAAEEGAVDGAAANSSVAEADAERDVGVGESAALENGLLAETVVASDLSALALKSFEEHQGEILFRAVTRSLIKYVASKKADEVGKEEAKDGKSKKGKEEKGKGAGHLLGTLVNLAGFATEHADTRCWSGLPERIMMAGLELPPGKYRIELELLGPYRQRVGFATLPEVEIAGGRSTILSHRVR
jgi:hypothetical protein